MNTPIHEFFSYNDLLDYEVLRPLSHIKPYWELTWNFDDEVYECEDGSFARQFNELIAELATFKPPAKYHDHEDVLAQYVQKHLNWGIRKVGSTWVNKDGTRLHPSDYIVTLEQGGFQDVDERELIAAASGRIHAAIIRGQIHYDEVEESHRRILAGVLSAILYHRADF